MRVAATLLVTSALAITGFALQSPQAAQAKAHKVQTVKADIDGDGRRDSVRIDRIKTSSHYRTTYKVTVKTAKGKKASRKVRVQGSPAGRITKPLVGTADVDGVSGQEIALEIRSEGTSGGSDNTFSILTWRKGRLVLEKPATDVWWAGIDSTLGADWRTFTVFDQVDGVNYALLCAYDSVDSPYPEKGRLTSYGPISSSMWSNGKWQAIPAEQTKAMPDSRCAPDRTPATDPTARLVLTAP